MVYLKEKHAKNGFPEFEVFQILKISL